MKQLITLVLCGVLALNTVAQEDTTQVKVMKKNIVTVVDGDDKVQVVVGDKENGKGVEVVTDEWGDTTHIRIGRKTFKVLSSFG